MKKWLLMMFALPAMTNAQLSVFVDSVYTYKGEEKTLVKKTAYIYESDDYWYKKTQESGFIDINDDGVFSNSEMYKVDYNYMHENNLFTEEALWSYNTSNGWAQRVKHVIGYTSSQQTMIDNICVYSFDGDRWVLDYKKETTKYNSKSLPAEYLDSLFYEDGKAEVKRIAVSYNENDYPNLYVCFEPTNQPAIEHEWRLSKKTEVFYNQEYNKEKEVNYEYKDEEWMFVSETDYSYENGLYCISEIKRDENGPIDILYYTNKYSARGANDTFSSVQSNTYPNPVSDILSVSVDNADNGVITLISMTGRIVAQRKINSHITQISVRSLPKGLYFLNVQTLNGINTHKIIIR